MDRDCEQAWELLQRELDRRLETGGGQRLKEHLELCAACARKAAALRRACSRLAEERPLPPRDFAARVMDALPPDRAEDRRAGTRRLWAPAFAVALLAALWLAPRLRPEEKGSVVFELELPKAVSVSVAGDFNGWDARRHSLKRENGTWRLRLALPPGRYEYAFVIDGRRWVHDSAAPLWIDNGYGGRNSVLEIAREGSGGSPGREA